MVRVVTRKLAPKKGTRRRHAVAKRLVRGPDGEFMEQFWVDANSKTFHDDLTRVFQKNVGRAREANTAAFGSPDGFPKAVGKFQKAEKLKLPGPLDGLAKK
jgi:hypothetical protein